MVVVHLAATALTTTIALRFVKIISSRPASFAMVIAKRAAETMMPVPMIPPREALPLVIFNVSILLFYPARMRMDAAPVDVILS